MNSIYCTCRTTTVIQAAIPYLQTNDEWFMFAIFRLYPMNIRAQSTIIIRVTLHLLLEFATFICVLIDPREGKCRSRQNLLLSVS